MRWVSFGTAVPFWSSFLADARHLPHGRSQAGTATSTSTGTGTTSLPFRVEVIQTDNGAEFQSLFHYHLLDRGIGHDYIKPRTPRLNGKVERSHRIDAEEFYQLLDGVVIDDTKVFKRQAAGVGELLQLPPAPRRPGWPDAL
jgi:transposase InsO family protein